jgi:hypothetical protein
MFDWSNTDSLACTPTQTQRPLTCCWWQEQELRGTNQIQRVVMARQLLKG